MRSMGVEGFLLYGPYVDLPAGGYTANLFGQVNNVGAPNAFVEVLAGGGDSKLSSRLIMETNDDLPLASIDFLLDSPAQVEIRIWAAADADVSIRRLIIFSEPDPRT
jgi:hypothetical protein